MTTDKTERRALLPALFDPAQGWPFSEEEIALSRDKAPDGNPFVVCHVEGREIIVAENAWPSSETDDPTPHRIIAFLAFQGIAAADPKMLLQENLGAHGMPSWGIDDDGDLTLSVSVIVGPAVPLDVARRQLLVGLGLISETVDKILDAVQVEAESGLAQRSGETTRRLLASL